MKSSPKAIFKNYIKNCIKEHDYYNVFAIFDAVDKHKTEEISSFYFNHENIEYINLAKERLVSFIQEKARDDISFVFEYIYDDERRISSNRVDKERLYYLSILAFILYLYKNKPRRERIVIDNYEKVRKESNERTYYRGQCNCSWRLLPSALRELDNSIVFDDSYYNKLLIDYGLDNKFNFLMRKGFKQNAYQKYAFMQHACSFSPLIDFTKSEQIATSFALSNASSFNVFNKVDATIFELNIVSSKERIIRKIDEARNILKFKIHMDVIPNKICLGRTYALTSANGMKKYITINSIYDLVNQLIPKDYYFFDVPTNDRMVYQQGTFICFSDCLVINGIICYEFIPDLIIVKKTIPASSKKKLLGDIYQDRKYDLEHLLNPYLFFSE